MATATGTWITTSNINAGFIDLARRRSKEITEDDLLAFNQRKHHYTFDVGDNSLDINGFILHAAKKDQGRHKFRVYLDSNDNGRFDKNDSFYGHTGLKTKHSKKGVGQILDKGEVGELKIKFKTLESNASMKASEDSEPKLMDADPIIKVMKFNRGSLDTTASMRTSGSSSVAEVTPYKCSSQYICAVYSSTFPCDDCYQVFVNNGCSESQANYAAQQMEYTSCCTQ